MKTNYKSLRLGRWFVVPFLFCMLSGNAQTLTDAIMMTQRESCLAVMYDHGTWDRYWEGTTLRSNATVATIHRSMVMPMIAIGLHNRVNLIVSAPYVKTRSSEPNGGKFAGAQGLQDIGLALKTQVIDRQLGKGKLSFLNTVGYSTPMTNYLSDYRPYSIGFGAYEWSLRGILQYQLDNGIYVRSALSHLWRGQTEVERDYYYNNGSYFTTLMDVPNAWNYEVVAGIWLLENSLRLEANYTAFKSTSGDDIRKYNAGQPTNRVQSDQIGFSTQYYFNQLKGLGLLARYSMVVKGRNEGKFSTIGGGITYQFKI